MRQRGTASASRLCRSSREHTYLATNKGPPRGGPRSAWWWAANRSGVPCAARASVAYLKQCRRRRSFCGAVYAIFYFLHHFIGAADGRLPTFRQVSARASRLRAVVVKWNRKLPPVVVVVDVVVAAHRRPWGGRIQLSDSSAARNLISCRAFHSLPCVVIS